MTVDFEPFAIGSGANVISQADWLVAAFRQTGFQPGLARSSEANKAWRQSAFVSSALANYIANQLGIDVLDDGDLDQFIENLTLALSLQARPARLVTTSATENIALTDYAVAFRREITPAAQSIVLPTNASTPIGKSWKMQDILGNALAYPMTISVSGGGALLNNRATYVIRENYQAIEVTKYADATYGVST